VFRTGIYQVKPGKLAPMLRRLLALPVLACCCLAHSQSAGYLAQYFQFRKMSSLSGSGFGVTIDGTPNISGAMAFSTPIAYSLGGNVYQIGVGTRSDNELPQFINLNDVSHNESSGDAEVMAGIGTRAGNFTFGYEAVSYRKDTVFHLEWQLPIHSKDLGVAVGAQNITNRPEGGYHESRSFYAVGTYQYAPGDHFSVGYGDSRFHGPFANTDYEINSKFKATFEWDTYEFNPGVAYSFGKIKGLGDDFDKNEVSLFLGYFDFHYATVNISWAF
jgi:hypothetical protein